MSAKHTQVQFVGYAVSTHPRIYADKSLYKFYPGLESEPLDLKARLELLEKAVEKAGRAFAADESIYRVFVIPEFFFRGPNGAYAGKEMENALRQGLDGVLAGAGANIDLAVWGTSLFAESPLNLEKSGVGPKLFLGDDFLAVYQACRDLRSKRGLETPELAQILFYLDELEAMPEDPPGLKLDPLAVVLRELLASCDLSGNIPIRNSSQVFCKSGRRLSVQKQYKSKVDFILNYYSDMSRKKENLGSFLQTFTCYPNVQPTSDEIKINDSDPYCIFTEAGLEVGVEICLDHIRRRLNRVNAKVDLQIIPSCGVEVTCNAVAARAGGYVFNCDGDYNLADAQNGVGSHTQLYRVEKEAGPGEDAKLGKRIEPAQVIRMEHSAGSLLPHDSGELHIYAPQPL